ncbi:hypothetical protein PILCRDRAFT_827203 [Piloderma croceum F 1598]|uniref:Ribonuclease H1 N-terminal domain-containing protein n=1 Tax=Piloderma croceum (strain F 1598) TaxID=765440 RepID=A0A0C3F657_PILCF|nr:hypothetical protein PILCRDRAFT_827203 [Piloderma croceum F 1598]
MVMNKWYVITRASPDRPDTRLGVYDNWPEVAEQVLGMRGAIYQGFTTEAAAISVWERAQARAQAAGNANNGTGTGTVLGSDGRAGQAGALDTNIGASPRTNNANVNVGRGRTRTHTSAAATRTHNGVASPGNTIINRTVAGTRNSTYPSPEPSVRGDTSIRNQRHHSRGRSISLSSEPEGPESRLSVDASISCRNVERSKPRTRTKTLVSVSANPPARATARGTPPREQRSHDRVRSISMRSPETERPKAERLRAQVSVDTADRNRTKTRGMHPSGSVSTQVSGDTSFTTAKSDRTRSWVAEMSIVLSGVPESATEGATTRTRSRAGARANNGVRDDLQLARGTTTPSAVRSTGRSPPVPSPCATVDTSYAISISSESSPSEAAQRREVLRHNSRSSRSTRTAPLPSPHSGLPTHISQDVSLTDHSSASQSPRTSSYRTAPSSPPIKITQAESTKASPSRKTASRADSASEEAEKSSRRNAVNSALSSLPRVEAIKSESLKSQPSQKVASSKTDSVPLSPSKRAGSSLHQKAVNSISSVKVTQMVSLKQGTPQTAGLSRAGSVRQSPSIQAGPSIAADADSFFAEPASPKINTPSRSSKITPQAQPQTLEQRNAAASTPGSLYPGLICQSNIVDAVGFIEALHVDDVVPDAQFDPRSPMRRGGTRNLGQPCISDGRGRPSPLTDVPTLRSFSP